MIFSNGRIYDGDWENDKMEGIGKMELRDGAIYEGEFSLSQRHGKGIEKDAAGKWQVTYYWNVLTSKVPAPPSNRS